MFNLKKLLLGTSGAPKTDLKQNESSTEALIPIADIQNGVVITKDGKYIKILEIMPVNFYLKSDMEQENIIFYFASYLKVAPDNLQIKVITQKADIAGYSQRMAQIRDNEQNKKCKELIDDNIREVEYLAKTQALTRRFFLVISLEEQMKTRGEGIAAISARLCEEEQIARRYLEACGLEVLSAQYTDNFHSELLYTILNPHTSQTVKLPLHTFDTLSHFAGIPDADLKGIIPEMPLQEQTEDEAAISATEKVRKKKAKHKKKKTENEVSPLDEGRLHVPDLIAPASAAFNSKDYAEVDGVYHSYLYVTGYGYDTVAGRGWLNPLAEAGEGVNVSFYISRQRKEKIMPKISQTIRMNRSRIRDISDTRQDFEEVDSSISAGLFIKNEMNRNNEEFYYMHTVIEVTANDVEALEYRVSQVQTLCCSLDMVCKRCDYIHEQAFLSSLPLLSLDASLARKSRRNILTSGVAGAFPFSSFEICDQTGIMLGINVHNRSVCMLDPFDAGKYENANISVVGMTGAGKTMLLQLMALRFRQQSVQTFMIAPLKGYEYRPACEAVGGKYIKLSPSSKDCINIMEIRRATLDPDSEIGRLEDRADSLLADKISTLHIFFSLLKQSMTEEDKNLLDEAFMKCYARFGISHDNKSLFKEDGSFKKMPTLRTLHEVLTENRATKHLAIVLTRFVSGSATSLGGETNVDLNNKYIVLDISEIGKDLIPLGMLMSVDFAYDKCKESRLAKKVLIIDELWRLIGSGSNTMAAEYVLEIAKLIRGMGGSFINATQDLVDYFALEDGKYGKAILNACRTKIILPLEEEEAKLVQKVLHLSDEETMQIVRNRRGEGLLCAGHNRIGIAIQPTKTEYDLITTSREDLVRQASNNKGSKNFG